MAGWSQTFTLTRSEQGPVILGRAFFDRFLAAKLAIGEQCTMTLAEWREPNTQRQLRAIWGPIYQQCLEVICAHEGYRRDEWPHMKELIHEGLCGRFKGYDVCPVTKKDIRRFRLSKATNPETREYIEWIAQFMAEEYGHAIELPGEAA